MMISTKGRYALRIIVDLAEHQTNGYLPLKEIALRQEVSEKYMEGILKILVQNKILSGLRGKGGGYRLAMPPEDCTIGSILRLTEGTLAPVACLGQQPQDCPRKDKCRTLPMWRRLDALIGDFFDHITVADLMCPAPPAEQDRP